ncbi:MAG: hypothetical protein ACREIT_05395 [Tepidisphaeraceae bacterium]
MTVDAFKRFLQTRPFQSFAIHVADGRAFDVRHPDAALLSPSGRTMSVVNDTSVMEVLDVLLVTSLRPLTEMETRSEAT